MDDGAQYKGLPSSNGSTFDLSQALAVLDF